VLAPPPVTFVASVVLLLAPLVPLLVLVLDVELEPPASDVLDDTPGAPLDPPTSLV
jgi:hypothetical protein